MKKKIIIGAMAIVAVCLFAVSSCTKEKNETSSATTTSTTSTTATVDDDENGDSPEVQQLMVTDIHNSDCLHGGEKSDTIGGVITLDRRGNNLYFDWPRCMSGCGLDSFAVRSNIIDDTLEIDVRSYGQWANCTCNYDLNATINNVPSKRYFVKLYYCMVVLNDIRGELWYSKWMNL